MKSQSQIEVFEFLSPSKPVSSFLVGLAAPVQCLKFLLQNKGLLVIGLAPHALCFAIFLWLLFDHVSPLLSNFLWNQMSALYMLFFSAARAPEPNGLVLGLLGAIVWILGLVLYGLIGASFVNVLFSPLQDIIAKRCFANFHSWKPGSFSLKELIQGLVSEFGKLLILITFLGIFVLAPLFFPGGFLFSFIVSPILLVVTAWFNGWDFADRTLALLNLSLPRRLEFGLRAPYACVGLGVWTLIPFVSTFIAFCFAGAGGIVVAKTIKR